jgi:hypothetical protein
MTDTVDSLKSRTIQDEIEDLERRLQDAKARLSSSNVAQPAPDTNPPKVLNSDGMQKLRSLTN